LPRVAREIAAISGVLGALCSFIQELTVRRETPSHAANSVWVMRHSASQRASFMDVVRLCSDKRERNRTTAPQAGSIRC